MLLLLLLLLTLVDDVFMFFFLSKGYLIFIFAVSKLQLTWENPRYMLLLLTLVHGFFMLLFSEGFFPDICFAVLNSQHTGETSRYIDNLSFFEHFFDIYFHSFKVAAYWRNFEVHWYSCPSLLMSSTEWLSGTDGLRIDVKLFFSPRNQNCFGI